MSSISHQVHLDPAPELALSPPVEASQQQDPTVTIARLRGFAFLLSMDVDLADRLVEVTLLRASVVASFSGLGESLFPWLLSRLRSYYYREHERGRLQIDGVELALRSESESQDEFLMALAKLVPEQREALVLIEAVCLSHDEAARICRKSREQFKSLMTSAQANLVFHLVNQRRLRMPGELHPEFNCAQREAASELAMRQTENLPDLAGS